MGFKRILILNIKKIYNNMNSFKLKNPNEKFFQVLFFYVFWVTILIFLFKKVLLFEILEFELVTL